MSDSKPLFDTDFQEKQRSRAAGRTVAPPALITEAQSRLKERLADIRQTFENVWEETPDALSPFVTPAKAGVPFVSSPDLILSCLTLQSQNDLAERLQAFHALLASGGLFMAALAGGETLHELSAALMEAEIDLRGGASPRVAPLPTAEDLARLLPEIGFTLPVVDSERVTLTYPSLLALMQDLQNAGETNALSARSRLFAPRDLFTRAEEIYRTHHALPNGKLPVTVDLIFLHGWKET